MPSVKISNNLKRSVPLSLESPGGMRQFSLKPGESIEVDSQYLTPMVRMLASKKKALTLTVLEAPPPVVSPEERLRAMTKADLKDLIVSQGLDIDLGQTKDNLVVALLGYPEVLASVLG